MKPKILQYMRSFIFYIKFFGKNIFLHPSVVVSCKSSLKTNYGGAITIGKHSEIHEYVFIHTYGGNIEIGEYCSFNPFCVLYGHGGLKVGNFVRVAAQSVIIPSNHKFDDTTKPIYYQGEDKKGIIIGDDVWIGAGCKILDGVTIGRGVVIGAGSVVTTSIPEYSIAVGVPARVIGVRGKNDIK